MNKFLCVVSTSRTEGFGLSILESMACGIPVVSYVSPGSDYLLGNLSKTGKVFNTIPSRKGKVTLTKDVAESLGYECVSSTITKSCKLNDWEVISYTLTEIKE